MLTFAPVDKMSSRLLADMLASTFERKCWSIKIFCFMDRNCIVTVLHYLKKVFPSTLYHQKKSKFKKKINAESLKMFSIFKQGRIRGFILECSFEVPLFLNKSVLSSKRITFSCFYCIKLPCCEAAPSSPTILDKTLN